MKRIIYAYAVAAVMVMPASAADVGKAKAAGEDIEPLTKEVSELGRRLDEADASLHSVQEAFNAFLEKRKPDFSKFRKVG